MDIKHHIEVAWKLTIGHIVSLLLLTLVMVAVSSFSLGILAPVTMAGYTQSLLQLVRNGQEPRVQDLFSHMALFFPLLGFGLVVFLITSIGFALLLLPGLIIVFVIVFSCIYMLPLMTDQEIGLVAAVKKSYALARSGQQVDHLVVVIIFMAINILGGSAFIGVLFTQPLATLFLLSTYQEKISAIPPPLPQET